MTDDAEYDVDYRENPDGYEVGSGCEGTSKRTAHEDETYRYIWEAHRG